MTSTRKILMVLGTLAGGVVSSAVVAVGCGGDDNSTPMSTDSGTDGTMTSDAPMNEDVVSPTDTGSPPPADAGQDAPVVDASADAPMDSPILEAATGDATAELVQFTQQLAQALCNRYAACCFMNGDASAFDMNSCLGSYGTFGYQGSSQGSNRLTSGHVAFDATQAQSCLSQINAIDCSTNTRTSAQEIAIRSACFGALTGTLPAGSPWADAIECAPGLFCSSSGAPANDAGYTGVCTALRTTGGACGDFGMADPGQVSETICSYRGSGNTGLTCHNEDYTTGAFFDAGSWQCEPQQAATQGCNQNVDCTTALCDPGPNLTLYQCATAETFIYPFACQTFIKDGG